MFSILRENVVSRIESGRRTEMNGFFTRTRHVKADAALALRMEENTVHLAESDELSVGAQKRIRGRVVEWKDRLVQQATFADFVGLGWVRLHEIGPKVVEATKLGRAAKGRCGTRVRVSELTRFVLSKELRKLSCKG